MVCNNTKALTDAGNYYTPGCKHIKQYTHVYGHISYMWRLYSFVCYSCVAPMFSFEWNKEVLDMTSTITGP